MNSIDKSRIDVTGDRCERKGAVRSARARVIGGEDDRMCQGSYAAELFAVLP
ncbi:MAG: hypothetical protein KatS3mg107_0682 [Gemmataceae bacterium]|nr:MAG: hypothetical protein KatS3mg107_0682 [Gemmataceae bacterium]